MAQYKSYRGRSKRGITILVTILLVAVVCTCIVYFVPDYLVFTEDGSVFLDLPFLRRTPSPSLEPSVNVNLVIVTDSPTPNQIDEQVSPSPEPIETPPASKAIKTLFVPMSMLNKPAELTSIKDLALANGVNHIAVAYKDESGEIADKEHIAVALELLSHEDITLTAYISACLDNKITRSNQYFGVKHTSGVNWLDSGQNRWINLYNESAREYILNVINDAREAGFEGAFVTNITFPINGSTNKISYGANNSLPRSQAVNAFLDELNQWHNATENTAFELSAQIHPDTMTGEYNEASGQELESFSNVFKNLYVQLGDDLLGFEEPYIPILEYSNNADVLNTQMQRSTQGWFLYNPSGKYPIGAFD